MKKTFRTLLTIFCMALCLTFFLTACDDNCEHTYLNDCDKICDECGEERAITHAPNADDGNCTTEITCIVCGTVTTEAKSAHTPNADDGDCTTQITCIDCRTVTTEAKPDHTPNADDGDCTTEITCIDCRTITTEAKPEHTPNADDGDCTTEITCIVCGTVTTEAKTEHTPHADDGNCTTEIICIDCGTVTTEAKSAHTPNADDGDCTTQITCIDCRTVTTEAKYAHTPNADDGDCTTEITCIDCGTVTTKAKSDHTPHADDGDCTTEITCIDCRTVTTEAKSKHTPHADDGDCTTKVTCIVCEMVTTEANFKHTALEDGDCTTEDFCLVCTMPVTPAKPEHIPFGPDDGNCMTHVSCKNCLQNAIEATTAHKDTNGDHICENPECMFPFIPNFHKTKITIGVGQFVDGSVASNERNLIPVISDETFFMLESVEFYEAGKYTIYEGRGLKEGTTTVVFLSPDGLKIISAYEYTVKNEDTVRIGEGELVSDITVDKTTAVVYHDDTLVTYTITTSADVDRLEFVQVTHTNQLFLFDDLIRQEARETANLVIFELDNLIIDDNALTDTLVENKALRTRYSAKKTVNGDTATWTIKWDLGYTAVRFIRIKAFDVDTNTVQTNYVKLNITYPVLSNDEEGFAEVVKLFVKSNFTTPMLFKLDDGSMGDFGFAENNFRGFGDFINRFTNTAIFGGNSVEYIATYLPTAVYNVHSFMSQHRETLELFNGKNVLCDFGYYYGHTLGFYYPISDELRAVVAYQNGYEIDEELFPYAHSILERASAVLEEIIEDGMTDFEKEKAIYTWMYEQGMNGLTNGSTPIPEGVNQVKATKTAYGVLNNYGGDCMGWSGTFYTLCNMAGLDCVTVDVLAEAGGAVDDFFANHRINMIRIDGEYYYVEAFWSWQKANTSEGTYRYMNMTTEKAATIYTWLLEENGGPLVCDYTGYLVDEHTGELLNQ